MVNRVAPIMAMNTGNDYYRNSRKGKPQQNKQPRKADVIEFKTVLTNTLLRYQESYIDLRI